MLDLLNHLDLEISINEDGKEFSLKDCGSGIQSLVAIAIYRYLADISWYILKNSVLGNIRAMHSSE
mgnify:CR=1 FL=1